MINVSNKLVFLTEGQELKDGINEAIRITRKRLFDIFSEGKFVSADNIVSTSKREPRTLTMAFCKFFDGKDIFAQDASLDAEHFLNMCNEFNETHKHNHCLAHEQFKGIIPNFETSRENLAATFLHQIKRGILVMLFVLWKNRHILLTTNYSMPTSVEYKKAPQISMCEPFYTEVISFFQEFRQRAIPGTAKLEPSKGLSSSIQNAIQSFAYRVVVATDWHRVEDVKCEDCINFLDHLTQVYRENKRRTSFPIVHMVSLLHTRTGRLNFTAGDMAAARQTESNPLETELASIDFRPSTIKQGLICEPLSGKEIYSNNSEWIDSQLSYIYKYKSQGKKSSKSIEDAFALLNRYLFSVIPEHRKINGEADTSPPPPIEFDRRYFNDGSGYPTLREFIETRNQKNRKNQKLKKTTVSSYLTKIDLYFTYLAQIDAVGRKEIPFLNPIIRDIDFPLSTTSKGTNKKTVSRVFTPALMAYLYAMESLFEYIFNALRDMEYESASKINLKELFSNYHMNNSKTIKTEDLGFCPFIIFRGEYIPITEVKMDVFAAADILLDHMLLPRMPAWSTLAELLVCIETGIRTMHVEWLDIRKYDQEINRAVPLADIVELYVSTDKVKDGPWIAKVSKRVIEILDKQKKLLSSVNQGWAGVPRWYDGHEDSKFGKIVPAFPSLALTSVGLPNRSGYEALFKRMFYSFQEFANKNELFSKKIAWVECDPNAHIGSRYKSDINPHSLRATVISNAIHHLPPEIIGLHISGHSSVSSVSHYVVYDELYMDELAAHQANVISKADIALLDNATLDIRADDPNSALNRAIKKNKDQAMFDFSAMSFENQSKNGEVVSGLKMVNLIDVDQFAHHPTHLCPCNNVCPPDVVEQIGERNCGQCWLSLKTVDHIPRIDAHIRKLYAELKEDIDFVSEMIGNKASKCIIEEMELANMHKSAEITAWVVSLNVLEESRKHAATKGKFLVGRPEIVEKHILRMVTEDNPMTNLLLRVRDAISYPEYLTPQLKASMTKTRNMLLIKTEQYGRLVSEPKGYDQVDEFRGIIRGVLETTNLTLDQLQVLMTSEVPQVSNRIPMLEIA